MGRFDKLPGIDSEQNTTRRNALIGGGYAFLGLALVGAITGAGDDDEDDPDENGSDDDDVSNTDDTDDDTTDDTDDTTAGDTDDDTDEEPPELEFTDGPLASYRELDDDWFIEETVTFSGTGQDVTEPFEVAFDGIAAFAFDHDGESNFIVDAVHEETGNETLLINTIGEASGAVAVPAEADEFILDVNADGDWEITFGQPEPPSEEFRRTPTEASDSGNQLYGPLHIDGTVTVSGEFEGEGNFIVELIEEWSTGSADVELVFNEIDDFEGSTTVTLNDWWGWLDVVADDGEWTVEFE